MNKEAILEKIIELFQTLPDGDDEMVEAVLEEGAAPTVEETKAP